MKVSIITVTYNSAKTLTDTINSVLNQDSCDIEYIIIDGKSNDNTLHIVQSYGSKISKYISEPDKGMYDAMNKGIKLATGDIVGILNSDDIYNHNNTVHKVVETFEETGCDAVYGDLVYVHQNNLNKVIRKWTSKPYNRSQFKYGWMPPHPTFFVKKEIYEKYGVFNTALKSAADYEIMLRFLYKHRITPQYIPEILVRMRAGGVSNANMSNRIRANKEDRMAWKINELDHHFFTIWLKPIRKIFQFFLK